MKKEFLTILTFVFILQFASASYLSGDIMLYENGESRFDIETDTPLNIEGLSYSNEKLTGRTSALTTKEGKVWTFTLNLENYDNILLDVNLPANLKTITSINNEEAILDTQEKKISLINPTEKFLSISYTLEERTDYTFVFWIILIFIILIIFYIYMRKKLKKEKMNNILPYIN
ncbi:hypothetical protein HY450_00245 [Candidatus Pacearchaeota archaeon]|nr:hypothetical protein [Candidatus Pacearchaeota archaeon]